MLIIFFYFFFCLHSNFKKKNKISKTEKIKISWLQLRNKMWHQKDAYGVQVHTHIVIQGKEQNDFRLYSGQVGCMGMRTPLEYPQFELAFFPTTLSAFYLVPKNSHRFFFKCQLH